MKEPTKYIRKPVIRTPLSIIELNHLINALNKSLETYDPDSMDLFTMSRGYTKKLIKKLEQRRERLVVFIREKSNTQ